MSHEQLCGFFERVEIEPSATVLIHSSFSGLVQQGIRADELIESGLEHLVNGTLMFPTLSWREVSPESPMFSVVETVSNVGFLSEVFRTKYAQARSVHPTHSIAATGRFTDLLTSTHHLAATPCGVNSPWSIMGAIGTHIILLGCDLDSCTLFHTLEELIAPELYLSPEKEFYDCHLANGRVVRVETRRHRRLYRNFWKFGGVLAEAGLLQETKFNSIDVKVFSARDVMSLCAKEFNRNPLASLAEEGERGKWM